MQAGVVVASGKRVESLQRKAEEEERNTAGREATRRFQKAKVERVTAFWAFVQVTRALLVGALCLYAFPFAPCLDYARLLGTLPIFNVSLVAALLTRSHR